MQTVSQTYLDLFAGQHRVEVRVKIDRDDYPEGYWILQDNNLNPILTSSSANIEVTPFPSADLQEGQLFSVTITGGLFATQSFTIGSCVSREIEVRFILGNAQIPRMAKIQPEVRLVNDDGDTSEWIPKGTFWLDTRELDKTTGIMTIRGYDAMLKGENLYIVPGEDVGEWPKTMASVATEIAGMMGLTIDSRTTLDQTYEMQLPTDYSMRELLGYIAVANAGNWVITDAGELRLIRVDDTVDSVDLGLAAKTYHIAEPYQAFSKVEIDLSETDYVEAGDDTGRTLEIAIPIVSTTQAQTIAADVLDALDGFIYTPLTADGAILDPAMEIGDHVTVGETTSVLATQTMRLDSLCTSDVSAPGEDELDHEYPYESTAKRTINRRISDINTKLFVGPDSIVAQIEATDGRVTNLTTTVNGISTRVGGLENDYSAISQKVNNITLSVSTSGGMTSISLSSDGSPMGSGSIDLTGYATFTSLSNPQSQTFIDGANIMTGTISADRVDVSSLHVDTVYIDYNDAEYAILSSTVSTTGGGDTNMTINIGWNENVSRFDETTICIYANTIDMCEPVQKRYGVAVVPSELVVKPYPNGDWSLGDEYYAWSRLYLGSRAYLYYDSSYNGLIMNINGTDKTVKWFD